MWHTKALIAVLKVILFWQPFFSVIQSYRFLCRCLREGCTSQNHWVVEVMREMTSGDYLVPLKQVQMMMVAPDHVQIAFEYLQEGNATTFLTCNSSEKSPFFPWTVIEWSTAEMAISAKSWWSVRKNTFPTKAGTWQSTHGVNLVNGEIGERGTSCLPALRFPIQKGVWHTWFALTCNLHEHKIASSPLRAGSLIGCTRFVSNCTFG